MKKQIICSVKFIDRGLLRDFLRNELGYDMPTARGIISKLVRSKEVILEARADDLDNIHQNLNKLNITCKIEKPKKHIVCFVKPILAISFLNFIRNNFNYTLSDAKNIINILTDGEEIILEFDESELETATKTLNNLGVHTKLYNILSI